MDEYAKFTEDQLGAGKDTSPRGGRQEGVDAVYFG
jgi:hypothetical protein